MLIKLIKYQTQRNLTTLNPALLDRHTTTARQLEHQQGATRDTAFLVPIDLLPKKKFSTNSIQKTFQGLGEIQKKILLAGLLYLHDVSLLRTLLRSVLLGTENLFIKNLSILFLYYKL